MNLPRQLAGTLLAIGGLMIALSMPSTCHGQVAGLTVIAPQASGSRFALDSAEVNGGAPIPGIVGPTMTGSWYDPAQSGHGIFLEILSNDSAFLGWFSFDPAGTQQVWFGGVGTYSGNTVTFDAIDMPTGGRWIPNFDPAGIVHNAWGSLTLTFTDADHGRADFNSVLGYGSGSMMLTRLTQPVGSSPLDTSIGHPTGVATDSMGNVYFNSPSVVFKLDTQGTLTRVAGSLSSGYSGDGGAATQALLNFPYPFPELVADPIDWSEYAAGLAVDDAGNTYIADSYNHRVRKVDPRGIITTIAGDGTKGASGDGGIATAAQIGWPQAVALDAGGNLYVSAWTGLRKVTPDGIITTLAEGNCGSNGSEVCAAEGVAVDGNGNLYVADGLCRIRVFKPDGSTIDWAGRDLVSILGGNKCGFSGDGVPATSAAFNYPYGVATDKSGNVYIADTYNDRIRKVDTSGIVSTVAGGLGQGFSGDGGPATNARLYQPVGVAVDATGDIYIADTGNNRIRKVSSDGTITTIAGNGDQTDIALAHDTGNIGAGYSGAWYDPAQSGHGIFLEILPGNSAFLGWFTFNPGGTQQVWFGGVGSYSGNTLTISAVDQPTGGRWIPNFNPAQIVHNAWGSMVLTFTDCNHGRVDFNSTSGYGIGSMNLVRLTQPAGSSCP